MSELNYATCETKIYKIAEIPRVSLTSCDEMKDWQNKYFCYSKVNLSYYDKSKLERNFLNSCYNFIAVCIPLSDDEHRFLQKVHPARANGHWECGHNCNPVATLPHAAVVLYATI